MTDQTGKDAGKDGGNGKDAETPVDLTAEDLASVSIDEDEGKSEAELWAEMDAAEGEQAADEDEPPSASKDDDADDDSDADAGEESDAADADTEAEDEPSKPTAAANANGNANQGAKPADGGDAAPPNTVADPVKELEELRKENQRLAAEKARLEQADRSNRGRISALQRKIDGEPRGSRKQPNGGNGKQVKPLEGDAGKKFREEYPELAPVADHVVQQQREIDELKAEREEREAREEADRLKKNETVLDDKHPDWEKQAASKEFGDWVTDPNTPDLIRAAVARNKDAIVDAKEAVFLFDAFKAFRSSQAGGEQNTQRQGARNGAQDGPGANGKPNGGGKNGNGLSGKRQLQMASSSGTRSSGPGVMDGIPEEGDPEAIWKAFDRLEARQERQQRGRQRA